MFNVIERGLQTGQIWLIYSPGFPRAGAEGRDKMPNSSSCKTLYLVTPGPLRDEPDPRMTMEGAERVARLRSELRSGIPQVLIGLARRHQQVSSTLGLINHSNRQNSLLWGGAEVSRMRNDRRVVVLPGGLEIPFETVTSIADLGPSIRAKITNKDVLDGAWVCAGRETMVAFGESFETVKSGALYKVTWNEGSFSCKLITGDSKANESVANPSFRPPFR